MVVRSGAQVWDIQAQDEGKELLPSISEKLNCECCMNNLKRWSDEMFYS